MLSRDPKNKTFCPSMRDFPLKQKNQSHIKCKGKEKINHILNIERKIQRKTQTRTFACDRRCFGGPVIDRTKLKMSEHPQCVNMPI